MLKIKILLADKATQNLHPLPLHQSSQPSERPALPRLQLRSEPKAARNPNFQARMLPSWGECSSYVLVLSLLVGLMSCPSLSHASIPSQKEPVQEENQPRPEKKLTRKTAVQKFKKPPPQQESSLRQAHLKPVPQLGVGTPKLREERNLQLSSDTKLALLSERPLGMARTDEAPLIFDFPVTYNSLVQHWIQFFQGPGQRWYKTWLERSSRYLPSIQKILAKDGLPLDLAYIAMIESGYSAHAESSASAVGPWQFIQPTGHRYGLTVNWWLDERRDFEKSTVAAAQYLADLYKMFGSWYLVAAGYNTGENRIRRLLRRHKTADYWDLVRLKVIPKETQDYVPKLIAAMLIAKAPGLYGFRELDFHEPDDFHYFYAPGGTDLVNLARYLGIDAKALRRLNPELVVGLVPRQVKSHRIRIPQGFSLQVANYVRERQDLTANN